MELLLISLTLFTFLNFQTIALQAPATGLQQKSVMVRNPPKSPPTAGPMYRIAGPVKTSESRPLPQKISKSKQKKGKKQSKNGNTSDGPKSNSYNGNSGYSVKSSYNRANRKSYGDSGQKSNKGKIGKDGSLSQPGRYSQRFMHGFYDPFRQMSFDN